LGLERTGDGTSAAFASAGPAIDAAVEAQGRPWTPRSKINACRHVPTINDRRR